MSSIKRTVNLSKNKTKVFKPIKIIVGIEVNITKISDLVDIQAQINYRSSASDIYGKILEEVDNQIKEQL
jgi:uncharacterized alkaline shock family protein YloU